MPEYLSPGVYVEEVPSGNKPIEGVSTSTAGIVGVTERGPVNEPTLVTSYADFTRKFGGYLDHRIFTGDRDVAGGGGGGGGIVAFVAPAVNGLPNVFENGGDGGFDPPMRENQLMRAGHGCLSSQPVTCFHRSSPMHSRAAAHQSTHEGSFSL